MPLIIDRQQSKFRVLWRMPEVRSTNYEEISSNESQDTAEKELSSPSKVPLVSDRSQPNLRRLKCMCGECEVQSFRKIPSEVTDIETKIRIALHVNFL